MEQYFDVDIRELEVEIARDYAAKDGAVIIAEDTDLDRLIKAIRNRISTSISTFDEQTKELVCDRLDYCRRRQSEGMSLARDLVDANLMIYLLIPVPPLKLASYIIRKGYLDHLCACKT